MQRQVPQLVDAINVFFFLTMSDPFILIFMYYCLIKGGYFSVTNGAANPTELPTQENPTSVLDEPYFSNFTTISVIASKMQEHVSAT